MEPELIDAAPTCPLCGNASFAPYRGRAHARCLGCGSKERGRFLGLVLQRLAPAPTGAPVYHFAPERMIADILIARYGAAYVPADIAPDAYPWSRVPVRRVDLCRPRAHLEDPVQGLVHSHVLEHLPAPLERVVRDMNALLEPGGFHIFQIPVHPGWYREDMNVDMPTKERERHFFQHDHMRVFGRNDFQERVLDLFADLEPVDVGAAVTAAELTAAAVPPSALTTPSGHGVYLFRKPVR